MRIQVEETGQQKFLRRCGLRVIVCCGGARARFPAAEQPQVICSHLEETITLFPGVGVDVVVMTESITPRNSTKDGVLPQFKTKRWVPRRKAAIVDAVRQGVVSLEEVCRCYQLSVEEFLTWQRAIDSHGVPGLRVTRLQIYRNSRRPRVAQRLGGAPRS